MTYTELRTGRWPFEGAVFHVIYAHQNQPPDLSALPEEERTVVARALAKLPEERWPSCREFVRHLRETASGEIDPSRLAPPTKPPEASDSEISGTTSGNAHSHRWLRRAGLAVLPMMACLAALLYVIQNRGAAPVDRDIPARRPQQPPRVEVATEVPKPPTTVVSTERRLETAKGETVTRERPEKAPAVADLAARVKEIFRARCLDCHGGRKVKGKVTILDRDLLIARQQVVPGKSDDSELFQVITAEDESVMPPKDQPRLRPDEIDDIRAWIATGAAPFPDVPKPVPPPSSSPSPNFGVEYVLKSILQDVRTLSPEDRPFARYFSLNHLLAAGASPDELDLHRDALAKAINHLSWERELVHPRPIESTSTVFRIDLRALGWDRRPCERVGDHAGAASLDLFDLALLEYPYSVAYENSEAFDALRVSSSAPPARSGRSRSSAPTGSSARPPSRRSTTTSSGCPPT